MQSSEISHMDWYFGSDGAGFVIPKDEEPSDKFLSPDFWSQWGITNSDNSSSPNQSSAIGTNLTMEEFNFDGQSLHDDEADKEASFYDGELSSGSSRSGGFPLVSYCGGNPEASSHRTTLLDDWPDYQHDGLAGMDQTDDIFLSSLFEDDLRVENLCRPVCLFPESRYSTMLPDNVMMDLIADTWSISRDLSGMGSSKYLKTRDFPSSTGWDKGEDTPSHFMPANSGITKDCPMLKASLVKDLNPSELNSPCKENTCTSEETPPEEYVLLELEIAVTQLTQKTRICFRDALYRLAKNSEQHMIIQSQSGQITLDEPALSTVHDQTLRFGEPEPTELETNAIDRTIANLTFNKLNASAQDLSCIASAEAIATTESCNYNLNEPQVVPHFPPHPPILPGDAKVTFLGRENKTRMNFYEELQRTDSVRNVIPKQDVIENEILIPSTGVIPVI
ncbi:hypothetical protein HHK36_017888 [Tetracentron sinense]|uniref:Protein LNK3 n=1 Tax=Tetracentron sinense TaxID=13715 RepID=A0A835D9U0_TETSI|nr:hypothetical protein HHK36_017888 [Tetracentron sinense]